ncbi:response regulator transcription factor [Endothiovibrio diazotrophicus]
MNDAAPLRIYYVEDDADQREGIAATLGEHGFDVHAFSGSHEFYLALIEQPCHIAILDVTLPGEDGFSIAANLRQRSDMGIVMLTACGATDDRVHGLTQGADAYLVKPVEPRELIATLEALARRLGAPPGATGGERETEWRLTLDDWQLTAPGGIHITLSAQERSLLRALMAEPGLPLSRDTLIEALGHSSDYYLPHRLDMLVGRLRRKVLEAAGAPLPLKAVRGVGFAFSPKS